MSVLIENRDAIPEPLLLRLRELAQLMKGQDNACTAHPMFVVQQRRRIHGMDPDYSEQFEWIHFEGGVADPEEHEQFEAAYHEGLEEPDGWTRAHFVDVWESVQPFFSRAGAGAYIQRNRHNLRDPRIEVDSAYRNAEWQLVRELLVELAKVEA